MSLAATSIFAAPAADAWVRTWRSPPAGVAWWWRMAAATEAVAAVAATVSSAGGRADPIPHSFSTAAVVASPPRLTAVGGLCSMGSGGAHRGEGTSLPTLNARRFGTSPLTALSANKKDGELPTSSDSPIAHRTNGL